MKKKKYLSIKKTLTLLKEKNISLNSGFLSTFFRDSIGYCFYFGTYNYLQKIKEDPLINGGISGMSSWLFSYPFDVIKTQKQITNYSYLKIINTIKFKNYLIGLDIMLIRAFVTNAFIFYTFEKLKQFCIIIN